MLKHIDMIPLSILFSRVNPSSPRSPDILQSVLAWWAQNWAETETAGVSHQWRAEGKNPVPQPARLLMLEMATFPGWRWDWPAVPRVLLILLNYWSGICFQEPLPVAMTSQRQWPCNGTGQLPLHLWGWDPSQHDPLVCVCLICMSFKFLNLIFLHWRQVALAPDTLTVSKTEHSWK